MRKSASQIERWRETLADPVQFSTHVLGAQLWAREVELLKSIQLNRRTAIKACHGVGKTFTLAHAALWWLTRYPDGIVLTTAPTFRQVGTQLWSEIHRATARSRISFPDFSQTRLTLRGEHNFAMGLATNKAENFQGYHGGHVLIIADEAPGIESGIWDAIAGVMSGGQVHVVMAGILYELDAHGRTRIEPKEKAQARGVPSPDRAEALMLALGEESQCYEFISVRELERPALGGQAARDALDDAREDWKRHGLKMGHGFRKGCAY
jgi:hypothetical protein